ncbi:MAG: mechanosensitive ion channel family protein [Candidatus Heimdallarchaeota archaeon]|nr:mechanosensitive ion channel family protein [Candidatus Heimdallarchaeota archaeon]
MSFVEDFLNNSFLGNSGWAWLSALILFVIVLLSCLFIKKIILNRISNYITKRGNKKEFGNYIQKIGDSISILLIVVISLYFSISSLNIHGSMRSIIYIVVFAVLSFYLLKFLFVMTDIFLRLQIKVTKAGSTNLIAFLSLVIKSIIFVIVLIWFLSNLGVDTNTFIAGLGVFALAIAFALQNVISDIFAALVIYIDRPFEIDDYINVGGEIGKVEKIGIRSTRIRSLTGNLLIVSNQELIKARISNFKKMEKRRVALTIGVHKSTPLDKLEKLPSQFEELIKSIDKSSFDRCFFTNINTSSYDFEIIFFVQSRSYSEYQATLQAVNLKIIKLLDEQKILIPYPTQLLLLEKDNQED